MIKLFTDWITSVASVNPKYLQIVILENLCFITETLVRLIKAGVIAEDGLENALLYCKDIQDENVEEYVKISMDYMFPTLKELITQTSAQVNTTLTKLFGAKYLGGTFEKLARRVNKHFCKDSTTYPIIYPLLASRFRLVISKIIEKNVKDHKLSSVSCEILGNFMGDEGAKIVQKYSKKL
jgi:hypothetical protein